MQMKYYARNTDNAMVSSTTLQFCDLICKSTMFLILYITKTVIQGKSAKESSKPQTNKFRES